MNLAVVNLAVETGNLELKHLIYFHNNGFRWNEKICAIAAKYEHFDCLKYAHKNGCPWDEETTENSVCGGHLNCLQYAIKKKCPWNKEKCLKIAIEKNITSIINFIENEKK